MIWITGLPGSGKTTLAGELHKRLQRSFILDGDVMRQTFWPELGFDWAGREKNVVRTGEVARILGGFGIEPIVSTVSPSREARAQVRRNCSLFGFVEVYLDAPWEVLKKRRPTLYSIRYEVPMAPEFQFNTANVSPGNMAETIVNKKLQNRQPMTHEHKCLACDRIYSCEAVARADGTCGEDYESVCASCAE